ncbi:MAG: carboxypeptidase M32 [Planctomycetota bacterium]|nr:carboxypeptidase M32 [Planctomycetota bacterium]
MEKFEALCRRAREIKYLESTSALLSWDQQTKLPVRGGAYRAEQLTFLAGEMHQRMTEPAYGELLHDLSQTEMVKDPHSDAGSTILELKHRYEKNSKLPKRLVEELARTTSLAQEVWAEARAQDDFSRFAPSLKRIFDLKREEAEAVGYEDTPYDVLLDDFEPGAKTSEVAGVLAELRNELVPLIDQVRGATFEPDRSILHRRYPVEAQREFGRRASSDIGFDYERGRLDTTRHPFCSEMGPDDVRITTRYDETFFSSSFFGTLHEAGHGIYEQGLRADQYGLPPGSYCSLGIHESQSRLWENLVGRSQSFWDRFYPQAQEFFPEALSDVAQADFFAAINDVRPSLIRVEADEATYNLHIIIRFELEQAVMGGQLETDDLPEAWNEKYQEILGIQPPSAADGLLQDIHWSAGLIGYFATYSLGNLLASQFYEAAEQELGDLDELFSAGEFSVLKDWLNRNVHHQGARYRSRLLSEKVCEKPLSHQPLMRHLRSKLAQVYGF